MPGVTEVCSSKVPEVTLAFWIIKIAATMAGVTATRKVCRPIRHAGSLLWPHLGLTRDPAFWEIGLNTGIFFVFFIATVVVQVRSKSFHPFLYWSVIVATMTAGTTMADFADRSLGIGYVGGSLILFAARSWTVAVFGRYYIGRQHHVCESRNVLLDHDSLL